MNKLLLLSILFGIVLIAGCFHDKGAAPAPAPSPQPSPTPTPTPTPQPQAGLGYGLSEADFPGYTKVDLPGTGTSTLQDFPEESRELLQSYGFESVYVVVLQNPPLLEGAVPDENFRELQISVSTFATADDASKAFDKELELLKSNNVHFEEGIELGEKGIVYVKVFAHPSGTKLEQHVLLFLKGKRYASVSVTATEREDATELDGLVLQAAVNLAEKMPS